MRKLAHVILVMCSIFIVSPQTAAAKNNFTTTLDNSFLVTTHGVKLKLNGQTFHPVITVHKVLNVSGKTYVCTGHLAYGLPKEFLRASRIISSSGDVIKSGLRKSRFLTNAPKLSAQRRAALKNGDKISLVHRLKDVKLAYGETITCERSRKPWQANFDDGASRFDMPVKLWVPK